MIFSVDGKTLVLSAGIYPQQNLRCAVGLYLNGQQINKPHLEDLRQFLVEITAQGQTVQVGSSDLQRQWLDEFGGETILQAASKR